MPTISLSWNIFFIAVLTQSLMLCLALASKYIQKRELSLLALKTFLLVFTFILFTNLLYWNLYSLHLPHLFAVKASVQFLLAPAFYAYYQAVSYKPLNRKSWVLHLFPFLLMVILYSPIYIQSGQSKVDIMLAIWKGNYQWSMFHQWLNPVKDWIFTVQLLGYSTYIIHEQRQLLSEQKNKRIQIANPNFQWLTFLNFLFALYGVTMLVQRCLVAMEFGGPQRDYFVSAVLCVAVFSIAYIGLLRPSLLHTSIFNQLVTKLKYGRARLEQPQLYEIVQQVQIAMEREQLFRDSKLSLDDLAKHVGISRHHISQALSLILNQSFYDLLNKYRVEYALKRLKNRSTEENIKMIMFDSGFNNRTSFNTHFKKVTGETASQFLKSNH